MNILFVGKRCRASLGGIEKKMMGQVKALENMGHKVYYTFFDQGKVYLSDIRGTEEVLTEYCENAVSMYLAGERAIREAIKRHPHLFQGFYMRKGMCSPIHLSNLKRLKKEDVLIIEEIPTYPYDDELKNSKGLGIKIFYIVDKIFRNQLRKYVKLFVTYSEHNEIFGVKSVGIQNGIDVEEIEVRKVPVMEGSIRLLTVSSMYFWHGYDRLIRGVAEYYKQSQTEEVYLDMVGEGLCTEEWKKLAKDAGVSKYVVFHGMKTGKDLEEQYENAHVAVSSLGIHRLGIATSSTLKNREYVAKGIPMIVANRDKGIEKMGKYYLNIPDDESAVNIKDIVCFVKSIGNYKKAAEEMHEFALRNFTWEKQMRKVFEHAVK